MHTYYFEKLQVWQNSKDFVLKVYSVTNTFPESEKFGIISQIRRASTSISANIAEGFSRNSDKEKAKFINIAYGSAIEVLNFLIISKDLLFLSQKDYTELRKQIEHITNQLQALNKTISK
ncbi:four helix bundle protein [Elizabethkingia anophelis]|uniref:four helix bundle protein n=1 Tax=Elizabethkingia anophelis TaxID=1117645 RepID=UPI000442BF71|nr:four helix bundle protein [Elizabethkingia anophelis]CDN75549.1 conserved hypothetical protein [Elizabethkingia anophelis]CDN76711.1 conserved hypothetical protein [Elizabethkingia anophelis]